MSSDIVPLGAAGALISSLLPVEPVTITFFASSRKLCWVDAEGFVLDKEGNRVNVFVQTPMRSFSLAGTLVIRKVVQTYGQRLAVALGACVGRDPMLERFPVMLDFTVPEERDIVSERLSLSFPSDRKVEILIPTKVKGAAEALATAAPVKLPIEFGFPIEAHGAHFHLHAPIEENERARIKYHLSVKPPRYSPGRSLPLGPKAPTLAEITAFQNELKLHFQMLKGFNLSEREFIYNTLIPKLLEVGKYLYYEWSLADPKPPLLKVSGKSSRYLQCSFSAAGAGSALSTGKDYGSVKIYADGTLFYSPPRRDAQEIGGLKKMTYKMKSSSRDMARIQAVAKIVPKKDLRGEYVKGRIDQIMKGISLVAKFPHPHIATYIYIINKILADGLVVPVYYMEVMYSLQKLQEKLIYDCAKGSVGLSEMLEDFHCLVKVYQQIARGLAHLNITARLIHNDCKAPNILLTRAFLAKVNDFDLAIELREAAHGAKADAGTPGYFLPGERRGIHSDIYALGICLRIAFLKNREFKEMLQKRAREYAAVDVSPELESVFTILSALVETMTKVKVVGGKTVYDNFDATYPQIHMQLRECQTILSMILGKMAHPDAVFFPIEPAETSRSAREGALSLAMGIHEFVSES